VSLRGQDRAALRAEAHHLRATVHIGTHGITEAVRRSLDEALTARELVKLRFERGADVRPREGANSLAGSLAADVVQVIGHTATLFRENPALDHSPDKPPPWKR
jgi:RNA-binding protein